MKITRTGPATSTPTRRASRVKGADSESFGNHLSVKGTAEPRPAAAVRESAAVDALLAVQEVDDPGGRPAKARRRAEDLLDRLDDIRHGLLTGALSRREIENLAQLVRVRRERVEDPALAEVLDQIELRAEIELAKYSTLD